MAAARDGTKSRDLELGSLADMGRALGLNLEPPAAPAKANGDPIENGNSIANSDEQQPEENKDIKHLEAILLKLICDGKSTTPSTIYCKHFGLT